MVSTIVLRER
ncbi:Leucine-responsive regulatory protein, regulator for leucine (or lrp) regulon [Caballeronia sordidicola]|uniref:Leucine-responsive regulatory protein, regulator for leucine (Or lrp) regulon n=1 Tax=Caballeronia sordidicola TaxID=196367 RepID=A0A242M9R1_CABSO|nr:Leucine-responsive regulatory protein, regulator for leucine (or lrp) regulon [Caballeronia sordidicola]